MGRNYLKGRDGDRINAVLAAAGYNFGLLLRWLARTNRTCPDSVGQMSGPGSPTLNYAISTARFGTVAMSSPEWR